MSDVLAGRQQWLLCLHRIHWQDVANSHFIALQFFGCGFPESQLLFFNRNRQCVQLGPPRRFRHHQRRLLLKILLLGAAAAAVVAHIALTSAAAAHSHTRSTFALLTVALLLHRRKKLCGCGRAAHCCCGCGACTAVVFFFRCYGICRWHGICCLMLQLR